MKKLITFFICYSACTFASASIITAITKFFEASKVANSSLAVEHAAVKSASALEAEQVAQKAAKTLEAEQAAKAAGKIEGVDRPFTSSKLTGETALKSEPLALDFGDLVTYRKLQAQAKIGDAAAMMKMAEMIQSSRVIDPSVPYTRYWLVQAALRGSIVATNQFRKECADASIRDGSKLFAVECQKNQRSLHTEPERPHP